MSLGHPLTALMEQQFKICPMLGRPKMAGFLYINDSSTIAKFLLAFKNHLQVQYFETLPNAADTQVQLMKRLQ